MHNTNTTAIKSMFQWDVMAIIVTVFFNVIMVSCIWSAFKSSIVILEIIALSMTIPFVLFVPLRLIVTEDMIKIWRPIGVVNIDMKEILSCSIIENDESFFNKVVRTFGSGGLYGYWGYFRHDDYGKMKFYVTHKKQCLRIKLKNGKHYVISSPKREKIVAFIQVNIK